MSDLFKDHKPELTEEEDRLLWQRVRAIPSALPPVAPDPWWKRLFEMPAVRYGAPAFAVLLAAVLYVVERAPEPTLRASKPAPSRVETTAPSEPPAVHRMPPPPVVTEGEVRTRSAAGSPTDGATPEGNPAGSAPMEEAPKEREASAKDERQQAERRDADNFAQPPSTAVLQKSKAAATAPAPSGAPAPAREEATKKQDASSKVEAQAAGPQTSPPWGGVKSNYRDTSPETSQRLLAIPSSAVGELMAGRLPSPASLGDHPVLRSASNVPFAIAARIPPPGDSEVMTGQRGLYRSGTAFGDLDEQPSYQAAIIAIAFERALAVPRSVPRTRIEAMLKHARAIEARANEIDKPGASRLVAMIDGALKVWP